VHAVGAGRIGDPHHGDQSVTVQIFRPIFVGTAVVVVIVGPRVGTPATSDVSEHQLRGVGIEPRKHVDDVVVQTILDHRISWVVGQ